MAREPLIEAAVSMASHMIEKKHPASDQIQERLKMLLTEHSRLKRLSKERKNKLLDAVESQTVSNPQKQQRYLLITFANLIFVNNVGRTLS